jgi:hypothetical protein
MAIPALAPPDNPPLPDDEDEEVEDSVDEASETLVVDEMIEVVGLVLLTVLLKGVVVIGSGFGPVLDVVWKAVLIANDDGTFVLLTAGDCI